MRAFILKDSATPSDFFSVLRPRNCCCAFCARVDLTIVLQPPTRVWPHSTPPNHIAFQTFKSPDQNLVLAAVVL
ncbi:hypothetical protein TMatcc_000178 [Talaromyces marneffei ATCC 18224]